MIICKGGAKMVRGWENGQGGGGALYDTAMILCKECENGQGVHYMTLVLQ